MDGASDGKLPKELSWATSCLVHACSASAEEHWVHIWCGQSSVSLASGTLIYILALDGLAATSPVPAMPSSSSTPCRHRARQRTHFSNFSPHVASLAKRSLTPWRFITCFFFPHPQNPEYYTNAACAPVCPVLCVYILSLDSESYLIHFCMWRLQYIATCFHYMPNECQIKKKVKQMNK